MAQTENSGWFWTADEWARIVMAAKEERHCRPLSDEMARRLADRAARALRHYAKCATVQRRPQARAIARVC